jgi:hypothetical protein
VQPEAARLPVSLPPRPPLLAGREDLLAELHGLLAQGERPRTVVLCGLGGVGKTSLAAEYAHRHLGEVGVAWQVAAEDPVVLAADLAELAAQLSARQVADPRDPVASVHAVLAAYPAEWLLVFDNAPDEASVRRFLPPAGPGRLLVTSQSPHWQGRRVLEVRPLGDEVAAELLVSRTAYVDRVTARDLAIELGGLPLALEQAAGYMRAAATTLAGYLTLFRERRAELLNRGEGAGHPLTVAATLALALTRLDAEAPAAAGLLRVLACLAPEPVPLAVQLSDADAVRGPDLAGAAELAQLLGDQIALGDAVAALRRYSLVTPAGDGLVQVHRLVQAVVLDQMPDDVAARWRQTAAALIEAAIPADTESPGMWPTCAALLPHAQAVLADHGDGMARIAAYLGESGSYKAARDLWHMIAQARDQVLGPEHPATLTARSNHASYTGKAGDPAAARDLYAALLPVSEAVLGPEHPHTLIDRSNFAFQTGDAGDPAAARDLYAALLPVRERVSGPEHPHTLSDLACHARWTGWAGDPAAARDLFAQLLPVFQRVLGGEDPDTLIVRSNLARWTGEAGDPAAARDMYAALLPVRERVLGGEHPDTLGARAGLARWTGEAGDPAAARDMYAALLPVCEGFLGPKHRDTLTARANLTYWTGQVRT